MNKKIIVVFICVMLFVMAIPLSNSMCVENKRIVETQTENNGGTTYFTCYIEATGLFGYGVHMLFFRPLGGNFVLSIMSNIIFESNAFTTIYTEKDGDVLYQGQGQQCLTLLGYYGEYIHHGDEITILGKAMLVRVS